MTRARPPLKEIMRLTGLSRATIDRALNERPGVRSSTLQAIRTAIESLAQNQSAKSDVASGKLKRFTLIIQADENFTQSVIDKAEQLSPRFAALGCSFQVTPYAGSSSEEVASIILAQSDFDGVALLAENSFPVVQAASALRSKGVAVVTTNTDLDLASGHAFVGVDNRAAGMTAGLLMGRYLARESPTNVAVVLETTSYRCHEEREMGFRSIIRQRFPSINVIDVVRWNWSNNTTYASAKDLLKEWPAIDGIYNTSGGNLGLAQALKEADRLGKTLFIAHEFNAATEPLIRNDAIDFLITQDLDALVSGTVEKLLAISNGEPTNPITLIRPEILCKYSLPGP